MKDFITYLWYYTVFLFTDTYYYLRKEVTKNTGVKVQTGYSCCDLYIDNAWVAYISPVFGLLIFKYPFSYKTKLIMIKKFLEAFELQKRLVAAEKANKKDWEVETSTRIEKEIISRYGQ